MCASFEAILGYPADPQLSRAERNTFSGSFVRHLLSSLAKTI